VLGASIVLYRSYLALLLATVRGVTAQAATVSMIRIHANATDDGQAVELELAIRDASGNVPVVLTSSRSNTGFAAAHNRLLADHFVDGCSGVVVLNPDLVLEPTALDQLRLAAESRVFPALFGPVLELADVGTLAGTGTIDSLGIVWTRSGRHLDDRQHDPIPSALPKAPYEVAGISGACLYVSRAAYEVVTAATGEFFDEDFIAYREDAELGLRASILGVPSFIVPSARGRHVRRLRGTARGKDPFIDRLGVRNRFLLAFKYGFRRPGWLPAVLARDVVVLLGVGLRERSSWPGVVEAWRLRHEMRAKGRRLRESTRPPT
jgi:GT2 family glycosyltransferase